MKFSTKSLLLLATSAALMFCGERASAQSNTSQAVQHVQSGNKVFLEINAIQLESELNELFQTVTSTDSDGPNLSWSDVLGNGSNPGMDINFSSYDITGLGGLTSTGTLAADSLTLGKDAAITGNLSVLDAVSFGDSLTVSGFVEFSDSLEVVKAVTIGETLYVTGLTSLGDSVHVAGNVDLDALFNVDGAATFGSTMTVTGKTTLNDSLYVNSGANITGTLEVDGETTLNDSLHVNSGANIAGALYADSISTNALQINKLAVDSVVNNSTEGVVFAPHGVGEDDLEGGLEVGIPLSKSTEGVSNYLWTGNDRRTNYRDLSVIEQYYSPTETWNWMESLLEHEDGSENGYSWSYYNLLSARDEGSTNYRGLGEIWVETSNPDVSYAYSHLWMDSEANGSAESYLKTYSEDEPYSGHGYGELESRSTPTSGRATMYSDAEVDLTNTWSEGQVEVDSDEDGSAFDVFVTAYSTPDYNAYSESGLVVKSFPDSVHYRYFQEVRDADNNRDANVDLNIISDVTGEQSFAIDMYDNGDAGGKSAAFSMERSDWEAPYDATLRTDSGNIAITNTHAGWQMTNNMSANYPEFAEVPAEELAFLLGNNTGIHSQSVSRATHVGALDTRTAAIQSDVALSRVQASGTLLDWTATSDVAGDIVTESGQISPAAGLGFPAEVLESTFELQNIQQIPRGFLGAGRYASNPEVTNPEAVGQGIDQAIWAQDTLLLQSGYNSDDDEMTSTLIMVEEGIAVSGNSFYVTGETTLNDSLHLNSGANITGDVDVDGDVVVNDTNLLQIIASLEARIAALEAGGGETPSASFTCGTSTVTFDGHDYNTVEIGAQCWFAENLRTTKYADGSSIAEVTDNSVWTSTNDGARAAYDNDASNVTTYGYLYNWYAVDNSAGLCPTDWHVPTDEEWTALTTELGGESVAGNEMKSSSTDSPSWNGNNSSGFSALPGGLRANDIGNFVNGGSYGYWWSASPDGTSDAWNRFLYSGNVNVYRYNFNLRDGFSVRCLRDE